MTSYLISNSKKLETPQIKTLTQSVFYFGTVVAFRLASVSYKRGGKRTRILLKRKADEDIAVEETVVK